MEYGNLAYKEYQYTPRKIKPQQNKKTTMVKRNRVTDRNRNVLRICAILIVSLSSGFMISEFVAVNESRQQIETLKKDLSAAESATSQKLFELEQSVDLSEIEDEATRRLGMQRPEKYQTIYVNVKQNNVTEKTAGDVEGLDNRIASGLKNLFGNIVSYFSIK